MRVRVRLFGTLSHYYPENYPPPGLDVEIPDGSTVADLVEAIQMPREHVAIVSINGRIAKANDPVPNNAEAKFFQPLHGG